MNSKENAVKVIDRFESVVSRSYMSEKIQFAQMALMLDILEQLEYLNVTLTQEIHNSRNR